MEVASAPKKSADKMNEVAGRAAEPEMEGLLQRTSIDLSPAVGHTADTACPPANKDQGEQKSTPIPYMQVALVALYKGSQVR